MNETSGTNTCILKHVQSVPRRAVVDVVIAAVVHRCRHICEEESVAVVCVVDKKSTTAV